MAVSSHVRSKSLPSSQHPQAAHVDEQLTRLRSSEAASSSSICQRLSNLQDLHDSLDKMIRLSATNQALSQEQIEKLLDGSLKILDLCNVSKNALSEMKEGLMEVQSILRRKRGDLSSEVKKYLASRKSLKKSFQKVLKSLKTSQNKENNYESLDVFGEAEAVTVALFESMFSFMSGSKASGKWSLVSKLMSQNKSTSEAEANEFTRVDSELQSEKSLKMEDVQNLESCIQDLEDGIGSHVTFKKYLTLRKSLKKSSQKVLKSLKTGQNKVSLDVFGEAEAVTVALFETMFSFMSGSKASGKRSLVSKLMSQNKVTSDAEANEFSRVDCELQSEKSLKMEDVQNLESCIQDLEDGIESLPKSLIKYRVSLLNIL